MGVPFTAAHGSIRFSLSRFTTGEEVEYTLSVMPEVVKRLLDISPFWDSDKKQCRPVTM
jgi:cysteine desulfurase